MARARKSSSNRRQIQSDSDESPSEEQTSSEEEDDNRPIKKSRPSSSTYSRKGKDKQPASKKGATKGKDSSPAKGERKGGGRNGRRAVVSDEEGDEDDEAADKEDDEEDEGEEDEGGGRKSKDKAGPDTNKYAQQLVRLALFAEASKSSLKREDVNKKILGKDSRSFGEVYTQAQRILRKTFAFELVEVRPRGRGAGGTDDLALEADRARAAKAAEKEKSKKKGKGTKGKGKKKAGESDEEEEEEEEEEEGGGKRVAGGKKKSTGPVRAFFLRSLLPQQLIASISDVSSLALPPSVEGHPERPILDFNKEGEMPLMGILYVVLALILVHGRRLPDDQLKSYLKKLDLHPSTRLPSSTTTTTALTLETFLSSLVKHNYLEKSHSFKGVIGASQSQPAQPGRGKKRGQGEEGEEDLVWAWGSRAEVEISEVGLTEFLGDLYLGPIGGKEVEGESREEKKKRLERGEKERERLRLDVRRAAGGELGGELEEDE